MADVPAFALEPTQPAPEPYQGPVENDEDARQALVSLDLPVRPFERAVGAPADDVVAEPLAGAVDDEVDGEVAGDVPTFSLDDVAVPEEDAAEE